MAKPVTRSVTRCSITESSSLPYSNSNTSSSSTGISFKPRKIRKVSIKSNANNSTNNQITLIRQPLSAIGEIDLALNHLSTSDPLFTTLINTHQKPIFESQSSPFLSLSRSILYQQLAANAAKSIYKRFLTLCGGESEVIPEKVLSFSAEQLREIGVSGRKASYLHDLADKFRNGDLSDSGIVEMDDDLLLSNLTAVKGIGVWSVHMFMIFSLHRPDVLPVGDLGVRKGVQCLYGLKELPQPLQMEQLCEKWRPYRSVGSWYMWRLIEANKPLSVKVTKRKS